MSTLMIGLGLLVAVGAYAAYQLYKSKKAITVANVVAQAKADESVIKKP